MGEEVSPYGPHLGIGYPRVTDRCWARCGPRCPPGATRARSCAPPCAATLPPALTTAACREVLAENGFGANLVTLVAEAPGERAAAALAVRDEVRIVDFTGSTGFGQWLEANARQAQVYTEKSGVNTVVIDSTDDFSGICANLAFSLPLYSGQMCTTPQNVLVPGTALPRMAGTRRSARPPRAWPRPSASCWATTRAGELLGAIVNPAVPERIEQAPGLGDVVLPARAITHPEFPHAVIRTPVIVGVDVADEASYGRECFGPVAFLIGTDSTRFPCHRGASRRQRRAHRRRKAPPRRS